MRAIDASALVKYFSRERGWERVSELVLEGVASVELVVKEVANSLLKKVRRGEMSAEVALELVEAVPKIVKIEPQAPLVPRALRLALEHSITVYDALYVALAESRGLELITCDVRQASAAERVGVRVLRA
ncbi:MAG: PIN domain nuclease [Thermoprotei archaeon]|nr:MAG: PIN domain nuclease [Thermoprotei archaeon]